MKYKNVLDIVVDEWLTIPAGTNCRFDFNGHKFLPPWDKTCYVATTNGASFRFPISDLPVYFPKLKNYVDSY